MYPAKSTFWIVVLLCLAGVGAAFAQTQTPVADRVEEDWQLVVATPDYEGVGPQITTSMSPDVDLTTNPWVAFDMNYREYPFFRPGGMQLQVWSGPEVLSTSTQGSEQFNTPNETLSWTQRMSVSGGTITYSLANGQSATFDSFGQGEGQLSVSYPTALVSLANYSPDVTIANSGVSWQSNNVTSMTLVCVRYYAAGKLISTDTTPRSIALSGSE
jgi:hypothetical protein